MLTTMMTTTKETDTIEQPPTIIPAMMPCKRNILGFDGAMGADAKRS